MINNLNQIKNELIQLDDKLKELKDEEARLKVSSKEGAKKFFKKSVSIFIRTLCLNLIFLGPSLCAIAFYCGALMELSNIIICAISAIITGNFEVFENALHESEIFSYICIAAIAGIVGAKVHKELDYNWENEAKKEWKRIKSKVNISDKKVMKNYKKAVYYAKYQKFLKQMESSASRLADRYREYGNEVSKAGEDYLPVRFRLLDVRKEIAKLERQIQDIGGALASGGVLETEHAQQLSHLGEAVKLDKTDEFVGQCGLLHLQEGECVEPRGKKPYSLKNFSDLR